MDFFFKQVRKNETGLHEDYPFISPCGKELNFIKPADMPIVFHDLSHDNKLIYGGTLTVTFDPSKVLVSPRTGRLYHPYSKDEVGLIRSQIGVRLSEGLSFIEKEGGNEMMTFQWGAKVHEIGTLPSSKEPVYGLPSLP